MELQSDKKFFNKTPFIVSSISALILISTCAYCGYNVSGFGGALLGAFIGLTISVS